MIKELKQKKLERARPNSQFDFCKMDAKWESVWAEKRVDGARFTITEAYELVNPGKSWENFLVEEEAAMWVLVEEAPFKKLLACYEGMDTFCTQIAAERVEMELVFRKKYGVDTNADELAANNFSSAFGLPWPSEKQMAPSMYDFTEARWNSAFPNLDMTMDDFQEKRRKLPKSPRVIEYETRFAMFRWPSKKKRQDKRVKLVEEE
jgi:hypothetical protein